MKIGGALYDLSQVTGGVLALGTVPARRVALLDAGAIRSVIEEDFDGGLAANAQVGRHGWAAVVSGSGVVSVDSSVTNHPGIYNLSTGGTINSWGGISLPGAGVLMPGTNVSIDYLWVVRVIPVDANTGYNVGMQGTQSTQAPTNGIYFQKLPGDTNYFCVCRNGGAETRVDSGVAVDTGYHNFRAVKGPTTSVGFYIDAILVATITASVPQALIFPLSAITNTAAAAKTLLFDYYGHTIDAIRG
jgi:hypothetical protein